MTKSFFAKCFRLATYVTLAGLILAVLPADAAGEPAQCMPCWNLDSGGPTGLEDSHQFSYYQIGAYWNNMDCNAFNACHTSFDQPKFCAKFHWVCGGQALLDVKDAVSRNDLESVLAMARGDSPQVQISGEYALVLSCDRTTIIGAVRVTETVHLPDHLLSS